MESTWVTQEQALPTIIAGAEAQLRKNGVSDQVATVFARELRKALNRDNVGKAMAAFLTQTLSTAGAQDLHAFLQTSLGRKYLAVSREMGSSPAFIAHLLKPACEASMRELNANDRKSLDQLCPG